MNEKTGLPGYSENTVPISKAVISAFSKAQNFYYAKHDNGSLYISNGQFIMKSNQAELDDLLEQVNKRRRTESVTIKEEPALLSYVGNDRGKFELPGEPLEFEQSDKSFVSLFADDKQYFGYSKKYVDVFRGGDNRLFVDDNAGYDTYNHCMIVKSGGGEILGAVLPLRLADEFYAQMVDVLPLKVKWKPELDRIKENPTNDPYIGKEYFDGKDTYIISALRKVGGDDVYLAPATENGRVSRSAAHIKVDEMETQIMQWETQRLDRESKKKPPAGKENPPAPEENTRPFTYLRRSPWGEVKTCDKLCPGVFLVSTAKHPGGIMVTRDMTAAFSPAALKHGTKYNDFVCFGDKGAKDVALRELLDKKLWTIPDSIKDKAAAEEKINKSLREHNPDYWHSRQKGIEQAQARHDRAAQRTAPPANDAR
jgi:hypothetical protein